MPGAASSAAEQQQLQLPHSGKAARLASLPLTLANVVRMRGVPFNAEAQDVEAFFAPALGFDTTHKPARAGALLAIVGGGANV